jgi:serralysin
MANGVTVTPTGDQNIDALLRGTKWDSNSITFNFPGSISDYPGDYGGSFSIWATTSPFQPATDAVRATVIWALQQQFSSVANLAFMQVDAQSPADISIAGIGLTGSSGFTYIPIVPGTTDGSLQREGDFWYNSPETARFASIARGDSTWRLVMHELGHAVGFNHGHDGTRSVSGVALMPDRDSSEFSVMTYRKYIGATASTDSSANLEHFSAPQTLMMYDIAALQYLYGANYNTNAGNTVYTWTPATGQMFVDGAAQVAPGGDRIFMTLWDGNGIDTFDLSNYTTNLQVDLTPGGWSVFDPAQLALLDVRGISARGNVFNALMFNNDARSLIENVIGGSGNDSLTGNSAANVLYGGIGNDRLDGGGGRDFAAYSGVRAAYQIMHTGAELQVAGAAETDGIDTLLNIERLRFADMKVALDGAAGMTAELVGALFGSAFVHNRGLVGAGLGFFDAGMSYDAVAQLAVQSADFAQLAGSHNNTDFVNFVYRNVIGTVPSSADLAFYTGLLDGGMSQASLGILAAESPLNLRNIDLVGLQQSGLEYV